MKKIVCLWIILCSLGIAKANPIACPPVISEFYMIDNSHWYLELVFKATCGVPATMDGFTITTSAGTFNLKNGIKITVNSLLIITQDSLQSPLQINRSGDFINIKNASGPYINDRLYFGNIANSNISAPDPGQSIVNYGYSCWRISPYQQDIAYHLVKDNHPTIGSNPFTPFNATGTTTIGTFTGIVYDTKHNPVPGVRIGNHFYYAPDNVCENFFHNTKTDANGKFSLPQYSGKYAIEVFLTTVAISPNPVVYIEPDTVNYYEFIIDTTLTGIHTNSLKKKISFNCFPNPSTGETAISFIMPSNNPYSKALVKIYNSVGEIICMLPVAMTNSQMEYVVKWDGTYMNSLVTPGNYYCNLELEGQNVATQKIIISK